MAAYLADQIGFYDIPRLCRLAMDAAPIVDVPTLDDILAADALARSMVHQNLSR